MMEYERSWIEISKDNLSHNLKELKRYYKDDKHLMCVIKANAYGHDAPLIAQYLNELGFNNFAVASIDEALILRRHNIKGNILILGYTSISMVDELIKNGLTQSIVDYDYAIKLKNAIKDKSLKVQIQIDTGLHRLGLGFEDDNKISDIFKFPEFKVMGIYSHFRVADSLKKEDIIFTKLQNERFNSLLKRLKDKGLHYGKAHIQASYGLINYPEMSYDLSRVGMLMYGCPIREDAYQKNQLDLKPVLTLKSHIIHIQEVKQSEYISYGNNYIADHDMKVATISLGYKDGYPKALAKDNYVMINGKYAKILGSICMDQMMVDVSDIDCNVDDEVIIIGDYDLIKAQHLASSINSCSAEILSNLQRHLIRHLV